MAWQIAVYDVLVHTALSSLVLLAAAAAAVLLVGQPARKIRVIELALVGLLVLPLLMLVPGYPRLRVLPGVALAPATIEERAESEAKATAFAVQSPSQAEPALVDSYPSAQEAAECPPEALVTESEATIAEPPGDTAPPERAITLEESHELPTIEVVVADDPPASPRPREPSQHARAADWDFRFWIVAAYLGGAALMVLWSLAGLAAVARLMRSAWPASEACRAMFREVAGPAGERIGLLVSAKASQPCAVAWRPTGIILPESLVAQADSQALRWVLAHEWSHVARGDVWSWSLSGLVRWAFFYQPLVWWLRRQLQLCQDFIADAEAARQAASSEDYAEFLANVSSRYARPALAAGLGIGGGGSDLARRVVMLVENDRPLEVASPRRWNLAALPIALVLIGVLAALAERPSGIAAEPAADAPQNEALVAPSREPAVVASEQPAKPAAPPAVVEPKVAVASDARRPPDNLVDMKMEEDSVVMRARGELTMLTEGLKSMRQRSADPGAIKKVSERIRQVEERIEERKGHLRPWIVAQLGDDLPTAPNKIAPWDVLSIEIIVSPEEDLLDKHVVSRESIAAGTVELEPRPKEIHELKRDFRVQPDGDVSLGPICGRVAVAGLTEMEVEAAIVERLAKSFPLEEPKVQVARIKPGHAPDARPGPFRLQVGDEIEIEAVAKGPDARFSRVETVYEQGVRPGARYGRVNLVGLTPRIAEEAVRAHLREAFGDAKVAIVIHQRKQSAYTVPVQAPFTGPPTRVPKTLAPAVPSDDDPFGSVKPPTVPTIKNSEPQGKLLQPLDTVEILLALKPRMHRKMINGKMTEIYWDNMPQLSGTYVVEPDGDVSLPHSYGRVYVKGLSESQAGAAIRGRLSEKLLTRTALPAVQVVRRGRAVFPDGKEPAAGYRIRKGDSLIVGEQLNLAYEYLVGPEGQLAESINSPDKARPQVEGLTLAEAQEALQKLAVRDVPNNLAGGGVADPNKTVKQPIPIFLTVGGWREEADPEVIAQLEGDEKTHVQRLEREMRELKNMIRELKAGGASK